LDDASVSVRREFRIVIVGDLIASGRPTTRSYSETIIDE
jgi:hypothetical protein